MDSWSVLLDITGEHEQDGQKRTSNMLTPGRLVQDGSRYSIEFEELPVTGADSPVTRFTVDGDCIWMSSDSLDGAEFHLQEKQVCGAAFFTVYGMRQMTILPTRIRSEIGQQSGKIELEYIVFAGENSGWNRLAICYKLQRSGEDAE